MVYALENDIMSISDYSEDIPMGSDNYTSLIVQEIIGEIGFDFIKEVRAMPKLRTTLGQY